MYSENIKSDYYLTKESHHTDACPCNPVFSVSRPRDGAASSEPNQDQWERQRLQSVGYLFFFYYVFWELCPPLQILHNPWKYNLGKNFPLLHIFSHFQKLISKHALNMAKMQRYFFLAPTGAQEVYMSVLMSLCLWFFWNLQATFMQSSYNLHAMFM